LSATQPRILDGLMSETDVHSGFINRWLIIPGKPDTPLAWPPPVDQQAAAILYERIHRVIHEGFPTNFEMPLASGTREAWEDWYVRDWRRTHTADEQAMRARHATLIVKLALIYAVLNGDQMLSWSHLERGIAIIDWMWEHVARMVPGWGTTIPGRIEEKVLRVLRERGPMKRWKLHGQVSNRSWSTKDVNVVIEALYKGGAIGIDANGVVGLRDA
jgi:hypothetical protein